MAGEALFANQAKVGDSIEINKRGLVKSRSALS